jgi:hypothetical protein
MGITSKLGKQRIRRLRAQLLHIQEALLNPLGSAESER